MTAIVIHFTTTSSNIHELSFDINLLWGTLSKAFLPQVYHFHCSVIVILSCIHYCVSCISVVRYLGQLLVSFFEPCCPAHGVLCAIVVIVLVLS